MADYAAIVEADAARARVDVERLDREQLRAFERLAGRLIEIRRISNERINASLASLLVAGAREVARELGGLPRRTCPEVQGAA